MSAGALIASNNLVLSATNGSIGSAARPLHVTLTANSVLNAAAGDSGVYLDLGSGAAIGQVTAGSALSGYGDVVINATNGLDPQSGLAAGTVNVVGAQCPARQQRGEVGSQADPLVIQTNTTPAADGGIQAGVVNVSALDDIGLEQSKGDMMVGTIATSQGTVFLKTPGSILDAQLTARVRPDAAPRPARSWQALHLTDPNYGQEEIANIESVIDSDYQQYWQLLDNGARGQQRLHAELVERAALH